jgi:hypothetical protein
MKKMKRIMAMATAAAMIVGMFAMTASATDITSANAVLASDADGNPILKIPVTYSVPKDNVAQTVAFDYTLVGTETTDTANTNIEGKTVNILAGPTLSDSPVTVSFDDDTTWTESGDDDVATEYAEFDLSAVLEQGIGVYRYKLTEALNADTTSGAITASSVGYQIDLYVTYNEETEENEISYVIAREITTSTDGETTTETVSTSKTSTIAYNHGVSGTDLVITAHVEGNYPDYDKEFTYHVVVPVKGAGQGNDGVTLKAGSPIVVEVKTYDDDGVLQTTTETMYVGDDGYTKKLKDGESITLKGLPEGMIFTVTQAEEDEWSTRNTYSFEGTINDKDKGTSSNGSDGDEDDFEVSYTADHVQIHHTKNVIDFYNKRDIEIDTGVTVDVLPYVLVMVMALCGGILFVSKKRSSVR